MLPNVIENQNQEGIISLAPFPFEEGVRSFIDRGSNFYSKKKWRVVLGRLVMARPLRIPFENAHYHLICQGNTPPKEFDDESGRCSFLAPLSTLGSPH